MRPPALIPLVALALGLLPGALPAEEQVQLATGEVVVGELIGETKDAIELRRMVLVKRNPVATTVSIEKNQILRREKVPSFAEQYQARAKAAPDTLEGQIAVSRWCLERCLMKEAAVHAAKADAADSDNPLVAKLYADIGYIKEGDQWVKADEYLARTGKVEFAGKVMTAEEAEKAKAIAKATIEHDAATQAVKDDQYYLEHGEERIKDASDKLAKAKQDQAKAKGEAAAAKSRIEAITKRAADRAAQQQRNGNTNGNGNGTGNNGGNGGYGNRKGNAQANAAQQDAKDLADATDAQAKATDDQRAADRLVADLQRKLTQVQQAAAKAKDDLPIQQERLKKADEELAALSGKPLPEADKSADGKAADGKAAVQEKPKSRFGN